MRDCDGLCVVYGVCVCVEGGEIGTQLKEKEEGGRERGR